jgi:hypothetical protein
LSFYDVSVVCGFVEVTQVASVYGCGIFFLIELDLFYNLFFSHIIKKVVLKKKHVIKLYEIKKIKTHCTVDYNSNP